MWFEFKLLSKALKQQFKTSYQNVWWKAWPDIRGEADRKAYQTWPNKVPQKTEKHEKQMPPTYLRTGEGPWKCLPPAALLATSCQAVGSKNRQGPWLRQTIGAALIQKNCQGPWLKVGVVLRLRLDCKYSQKSIQQSIRFTGYSKMFGRQNVVFLKLSRVLLRLERSGRLIEKRSSQFRPDPT